MSHIQMYTSDALPGAVAMLFTAAHEGLRAPRATLHIFATARTRVAHTSRGRRPPAGATNWVWACQGTACNQAKHTAAATVRYRSKISKGEVHLRCPRDSILYHYLLGSEASKKARVRKVQPAAAP